MSGVAHQHWVLTLPAALVNPGEPAAAAPPPTPNAPNPMPWCVAAGAHIRIDGSLLLPGPLAANKLPELRAWALALVPPVGGDRGPASVRPKGAPARLIGSDN